MRVITSASVFVPLPTAIRVVVWATVCVCDHSFDPRCFRFISPRAAPAAPTCTAKAVARAVPVDAGMPLKCE